MKITRLIIPVLFAVLLSPVSSLKAQIVKGEVFFGGNACQVDGDECYGYKKFGIHAGAGALIPLTSFMDLSLEVLFNQKGAFKRDSIQHGSTYPHAYDLKLNYAEVPVMLYLTDKDKYSIGLGISYGRIVGIDEKIDRHSSGIGVGDGHLHWKDGDENHTDLGNIENLYQLAEVFYNTEHFADTIQIPQFVANSNTYKGNDFCICASLRYRIWEGLHAEIRYQYSMTPIRTRLYYQNITETLPSQIRLQHNNLITLRVAYLFNEHRSKSNKAAQSAKSRY